MCVVFSALLIFEEKIIIMHHLIETVLVLLYIKQVMTLNCYWSTECKYNYFSSKTPYEIVRGDIRDTVVKPKGCEAISIWAIMRHGKRNPSYKYSHYIKEVLKYKDFIVRSYEIGNSSLCAQDIENIKNWEIDTALFEEPNDIADEGYQEFVGIGSRLKEAFPEIFNDLEDNNYLFHPAFGQRMLESAKAFVEGLNNSNLVIEKDDDYSIMAPYSTCGKFQVEVLRNPNVYIEAMKFLRTTDYLNMKEQVEAQLGLNMTLSDEIITGIYDLCRYSWNGINKTSCPWCAIFSVENLKVLEYIGDLNHYYRNGYGESKFSKELGKIPLADLLKKFEQAKSRRGKKVVSYFTHATMMDMILVVLDLYKDANPLTGAHRDVKRKWRSTFLSTFASNMIAVLNRCSNYQKNTFDYNVAFYWNERPLLELCEQGVCSWQELERKFKPFLNATTDLCEFKGKLTKW